MGRSGTTGSQKPRRVVPDEGYVSTMGRSSLLRYDSTPPSILDVNVIKQLRPLVPNGSDDPARYANVVVPYVVRQPLRPQEYTIRVLGRSIWVAAESAR